MMGHSTIATTENYLHLARRLNDGAEHRVRVRKKVDLTVVENLEEVSAKDKIE